MGRKSRFGVITGFNLSQLCVIQASRSADQDKNWKEGMVFNNDTDPIISLRHTNLLIIGRLGESGYLIKMGRFQLNLLMRSSHRTGVLMPFLCSNGGIFRKSSSPKELCFFWMEMLQKCHLGG